MAQLHLSSIKLIINPDKTFQVFFKMPNKHFDPEVYLF